MSDAATKAARKALNIARNANPEARAARKALHEAKQAEIARIALCESKCKKAMDAVISNIDDAIDHTKNAIRSKDYHAARCALEYADDSYKAAENALKDTCKYTIAAAGSDTAIGYLRLAQDTFDKPKNLADLAERAKSRKKQLGDILFRSS
jgi:hypothetical protein